MSDPAWTVSAGRPYPLGASIEDDGINFALFSSRARRVTLCLFDEQGRRETARIDLTHRTDQVWHLKVHGLSAGQVYGYRLDGERDPSRGLLFDPARLLIDPYARRFVGNFHWSPAHELSRPPTGHDNAADTYKAVALADEDGFDWQGDQAPGIALSDTVIYEAHVKGFTQLHPDVPEPLRGRYEGLACPAAIAHLKRLGVTALCLLPVHQSISERRLVESGLVNYWGYNTIGWFVPESRYARHDPIAEFKTMVRALHAAGIEVLLDVVYNHTAEGDQRGPILSLKGIDNPLYFHHPAGQPDLYENHTGTGNAVDVSHPMSMRLVTDSLRYWVTRMHVDGFRFDLATTLGRDAQGFSARAALFQALAQDPVLSRVKLIAEPWDIGPDGWQTGGFPLGWSEWNDRFRDSARSFWLGKAAYRGDIGSRLTGSSDLFDHDGRSPLSSVNYLCAHDGFTLHDLLSYDRKRNEGNGEQNRDGAPDGQSWNCGAEGPTELLTVNALRSRLKRAMLATLFLSQGVPMLLAGDESGRSQRGNNNAYCQDNEINWLDWETIDQSLADFVARLIRIRRDHPQLRRDRWLSGMPLSGAPLNGTPLSGNPIQRDASWLNADGTEMTEQQWSQARRPAFGLLLGAPTPETAALLIYLNAEPLDCPMTLPDGPAWQVLIDTGQADGLPDAGMRPLRERVLLKARSLTLLASVDAR